MGHNVFKKMLVLGSIRGCVAGMRWKAVSRPQVCVVNMQRLFQGNVLQEPLQTPHCLHEGCVNQGHGGTTGFHVQG